MASFFSGMAASVQNFPDTVRDNFSAVTSQTVELTAKNIIGLRANKAGSLYFTTRIASLPWAYMPDNNKEFNLDGSSETVKYIGGGTYGKVFQGTTTGKAYKKMTMDPSYNTPALKELYYREVYLEAFIQTVLQNDPRYGRNIAAIEKVYRDQTPDGTSRNVFYYQMETIRSPNSVGNYLRSQINPATGLVPRASLFALLRKLASTLEYFRTTYGFYHRDLHTGNVLLPEVDGGDLPGNRTLKLIDFGQACMKSASTGKIFAVKGEDCQSHDLLIFICSLTVLYIDSLDDECIAFLNLIFTLPTGEHLYTRMGEYILTNERTPTGPIPIWHLTYHYRLNLRDPFWSRKIGRESTLTKFKIVLDRFLPNNLLTLLNNAEAAPVAAAASVAAAAPVAPVAAAAPVAPVDPVPRVPTPRPGSVDPGFFNAFAGGGCRLTQRRKHRKGRKGRKQKSRRRRH
jgi:hypothetical protein